MVINGYEIKLMRECSGKSATEIADYLGMDSTDEYDKWEKDEDSPSMNQFMHLSMVCGFNPAELIKMFVENGGKKASIEEVRKLLTEEPAGIY